MCAGQEVHKDLAEVCIILNNNVIADIVRALVGGNHSGAQNGSGNNDQQQLVLAQHHKSLLEGGGVVHLGHALFGYKEDENGQPAAQQGKDQGAYKETFVIAHVALVQNGHQQRRKNATEGGAQAGGGNKGSTLTLQRGNHRGQTPERHVLHGKGHTPQNVGDQRPHKGGGGTLLKGRSKQQYCADSNGHRCKQQIRPHFAPLGLGAIYDHAHHRVIESVKDTANQDDCGTLGQGQSGAVLEEYQGKHGHQRVNTGAAEGTHGKAYPLPGG